MGGAVRLGLLDALRGATHGHVPSHGGWWGQPGLQPRRDAEGLPPGYSERVSDVATWDSRNSVQALLESRYCIPSTRFDKGVPRGYRRPTWLQPGCRRRTHTPRLSLLHHTPRLLRQLYSETQSRACVSDVFIVTWVGNLINDVECRSPVSLPLKGWL